MAAGRYFVNFPFTEMEALRHFVNFPLHEIAAIWSFGDLLGRPKEKNRRSSKTNPVDKPQRQDQRFKINETPRHPAHTDYELILPR
jgi:hypothetical protein